jgi:hypothetical protein
MPSVSLTRGQKLLNSLHCLEYKYVCKVRSPRQRKNRNLGTTDFWIQIQSIDNSFFGEVGVRGDCRKPWRLTWRSPSSLYRARHRLRRPCPRRRWNLMTSLPANRNLMTSLPVSGNLMTSLPVSGNLMTSLPASGNLMTSLLAIVQRINRPADGPRSRLIFWRTKISLRSGSFNFGIALSSRFDLSASRLEDRRFESHCGVRFSGINTVK